jgi:hypothetical protein
MKSLLLISFLYLFGGSPQKEEKCYYFGLSYPMNAGTSFKTVMYTDIKDTVCNRVTMIGLSAKWADLVNKRCETPGNCTSDLNSYPTKEEAEKNLDNALKKYKNQYKLEKLNF